MLLTHGVEALFFNPNLGEIMKTNFRTYNIAVKFYRSTQTLRLNRQLRDQLERAASSIVLNLAEGRGRNSFKEQRYFFNVALGSLRESQAILDIGALNDSEAFKLADSLGAHLYKLTRNMKERL